MKGLFKMQKYTLIGHPLGHSMSPFIHDELFKISGIEATYDCTDIPAENFTERMADLRKLNGFNFQNKFSIGNHIKETSFLTLMNSTLQQSVTIQ